MTDPIQAAIERAEGACPSCHGSLRMYSAVPGSILSEPCPHRIHAAIARLAALVREYGHARQCSCCDLKHPQHNFGRHHNVHVDPRCLEAK